MTHLFQCWHWLLALRSPASSRSGQRWWSSCIYDDRQDLSMWSTWRNSHRSPPLYATRCSLQSENTQQRNLKHHFMPSYLLWKYLKTIFSIMTVCEINDKMVVCIWQQMSISALKMTFSNFNFLDVFVIPKTIRYTEHECTKHFHCLHRARCQKSNWPSQILLTLG